MKFRINQSTKLIKALIHNVQGLSFGSAQKAIRLGKVKVNNKRIKDNILLEKDDEVEIYEFTKSMPQIPILYIDNNILIVHKPAGIECATRDKSSSNTYSLEEIFEKENAIVVHRLDRLTEGIVILARTKEIARKFETYFRNNLINKHYQALVYGTPQSVGIKTAYLRKNSTKALVDISDTFQDGYKEIITEYNILKSYNEFSLLDIKLHTGRTHQIRGYFSHIGHPIVGDNKYGKKSTPNNLKYMGYFLTAYKISFQLNDELQYLNDIQVEIEPSWKLQTNNI